MEHMMPEPPTNGTNGPEAGRATARRAPAAPYVPYRMFKDFLVRLSNDGVPEQIELDNTGTPTLNSANHLIASLRFLRLADAHGQPTEFDAPPGRYRGHRKLARDAGTNGTECISRNVPNRSVERSAARIRRGIRPYPWRLGGCPTQVPDLLPPCGNRRRHPAQPGDRPNHQASRNSQIVATDGPPAIGPPAAGSGPAATGAATGCIAAQTQTTDLASTRCARRPPLRPRSPVRPGPCRAIARPGRYQAVAPRRATGVLGGVEIAQGSRAMTGRQRLRSRAEPTLAHRASSPRKSGDLRRRGTRIRGE